MNDTNEVKLTGRLTQDIELKYTTNKIAIGKGGIAVAESYKDDQGVWKDKDPIFVDFEVWGKSAEKYSQNLKKGTLVFLEGKLKFEKWTSKEGQQRSKLSVTAFRLFELVTKKTSDAATNTVITAEANDNLDW